MYKQYAVIENGVVLEYPVDPRVYNQSTNEFNISEYWLGGELDGKKYVFCHNIEPSFKYDEMLVETTPAFNAEKNMWFRQYNIVKLSPEDLAKKREIAQTSVDGYVSYLLAELESMQGVIAELSTANQTKWEEYRQGLLNLHLQSDYPFNYQLPTRPDRVQDLNIEVTRV